MKQLFISLVVACLCLNGYAQDLEIAGQIRVDSMSKVNAADSIVVRLADGTLAVRDGATLSQFQILSRSNDTIYLTNGGFVKLPVDQVNDGDFDPSNEIQILSKSNDTIYLSNGGFVKLPGDENAGWTINSGNTSTSNDVGIGTADPKGVLNLYGTGVNGEGSRIIFGDDSYDGTNTSTVRVFIGEYGWRVPSDSDKLQIHGQGGVVYTYDGASGNMQTAMTMNSSGDFLIGSGSKFATGHKLSVDGKIASEEVRVQNDAAWPDYVFSPSYKLMSLGQVEHFIGQNKHLPGIPSAKTVEEEGFELGSMSAKLLEKIEEITLHVINQQKEIDTLKKAAEKQQKLIKELKEKY